MSARGEAPSTGGFPPPDFNPPFCEWGATPQAEAPARPLNQFLDAALRDPELSGDFLIAVAFRQQLDYSALACGDGLAK